MGERWLGRGLAIAAVAAAVIGCAAGSDGPSGTAGQGGGAAGAAGTTGSAGTGSAGTTGAAGTACVMPPVVKMAWTIGRDATGPEITCDQAGASSVQLTMNQTATSFSCAAKTGTSMGLPAGSYTPRVLLSGSQGTLLSQGNLNPVTVPSCGVIDLGRVRFVVAATGAAGTSGAAGGGGAGTSGAAGTTGAGGTTGTAGTTGAAGTGGGTGPCDASPIFAIHSCAAAMACHDGSGSAANFDMKTTGWEKKLVGGLPKAGGASGLGSLCLQAGVPYLKAGSQPATGLFLDKLFKAKPECGAQMPLIPPNLSASEMDCVQRWANGLTK